MRHGIILCGLLLAAGLAPAAHADATWSISARQPCTGLTAGWVKPLVELNKLVGPRWRAAQGPFKGQGLVLLFITACPNSSYSGKATGPVHSAFILVPVNENAPAGSQTHAIAVLAAAGTAGTPIMKLFQSRGVPVTAATIALAVRDRAKEKSAVSTLHFAHSTFTLDAEFQPVTQSMHSTGTTAVRVSPPGVLFNGPESSTRYAKGQGQSRNTGSTWLAQFGVGGNPLLVTLDTDFIWQFAFQHAPHP